MSDSDMDSDEREALAAFKAEGFDKKLELEEKARHAKTEQEAERAATAREERERKAEEERQRERVLEQKKRPRILVNPRVFMEVSVTGKLKGASGMAPCEPEMLGRIVFELYINQTPRTVENFRALCTGECGTSTRSGVKLHYLNTLFHRILPGFVAQGGDFVVIKDGITYDNLGESIYGGAFEDEGFAVKHTGCGILSMANAGADTNTSQFFITLGPAPHLDGKHTAFGRVVSGVEVLNEIEKMGRKEGDPRARVEITKCGQLSTNGNEIKSAQAILLAREGSEEGSKHKSVRH
eukprot:TRINITY_DN1362_c0_g1_i4.p1 TRINITY_DN1362_c0_g1~~TRINITY_DN1362_c0_g1_i4.p1  ORF type:complete len:295 (-),score=75.35 TRINITY_DN1362_c0_g1_i4:521-1405(-)